MKHSRLITAGLAVCLLTAVTSFGKPADKVFKRDRYLLLDSRIAVDGRWDLNVKYTRLIKMDDVLKAGPNDAGGHLREQIPDKRFKGKQSFLHNKR